jgi:general L-amino acid transport system permease protein
MAGYLYCDDELSPPPPSRRRSELPAIRSLCVLYVGLVRGVPPISLLFMAGVSFRCSCPAASTSTKLLRAQIAIVLFAGAYPPR